MTASHLFRHRSHRPLPPIILSGTSYFGIALLFVAALWLSNYNFFPTIRDSVKVPVSVSPFPCFMDGTVQITMNANRRLSVDLWQFRGKLVNPLQAALFQKLAERHGIYLSSWRLFQLENLQSLSSGIERLAYCSSLAPQPYWEANYRVGLSSSELQEMITAVQEANMEQFSRYTYFTLRIDERCKPSDVWYLISTLQSVEINRFFLATVSY